MVHFKRNTFYLQHWSEVRMAWMTKKLRFLFSFRSKQAAYRDHLGQSKRRTVTCRGNGLRPSHFEICVFGQGRLDIGSQELCTIKTSAKNYPSDQDQETALAFSSDSAPNFSNFVKHQ